MPVALAFSSDEPYRLPSFVRVRVVPPHGARAVALDRVTWLTPYVAETIGEDARRAGPGTRLEVIIPQRADTPASRAQVIAVRALFAWLSRKGVEVSVTAEEDHEV
jgi:hypothetical protein